MGKVKKILISVAVLLVISGTAAGVYYYSELTNYLKTNNASVSADMVTVTPLISGVVSHWNVKEGDAVTKGQVLGKQDLSMLMTSSDINATALKSSADTLLSKSEIRSPLDGTIVQSHVLIGVTLAPGMTAAIVADTENMYIKANIEETEIFKLKVGQYVSIKIDAYPSQNFTGYVETVGMATQNAFSTFPSMNTSGTYSKVVQLIPVKITLVNDDNLPMLIGMNATVKISIK